MKNAEWIIKEGIPFKKIKTIQHNAKENRWYEITVRGKVVDKVVSKLEPADLFRKWLDMERKEPILDDVEKRYLKGVIRPFRDRVQAISKEGNSIVEWLSFKLVNNAPFELPFFKSGRMYKNMERGKEYTLDELGL